MTTQVVERHIVRGLEKIFYPVVVNSLSDILVEGIASEPDMVREHRKFLEERISKLKNGQDIFRGVMAGSACWFQCLEGDGWFQWLVWTWEIMIDYSVLFRGLWVFLVCLVHQFGLSSPLNSNRWLYEENNEWSTFRRRLAEDSCKPFSDPELYRSFGRCLSWLPLFIDHQHKL